MLTPLAKILDRAQAEKQDSDAACFSALMYMGEMLLKLVAAGLISAVRDDKERHRYRLEHKLVRADGLGDWASAIDDILTGPSSQFLDTRMWPTQRELTRKLPASAWQTQALRDLSTSLRCVNLTDWEPSSHAPARNWFNGFVRLRNGTKGHGAPSTTALSDACPSLERSIVAFATNLSIFEIPWAYLRRNLSGKYRVTAWNDTDQAFEKLKREDHHSYADGVYLSLDRPRRAILIDSNAEASDYWLANGRFSDRRYELLSYLTNDRRFAPSAAYMQPVDKLPQSETQGIGQLEPKGSTFTNLPEPPARYVSRHQLETELEQQLRETDRHFIVTLTGRGGIGKTWTALQVINSLLESSQSPYHVVIWFSARDVDLLDSGPKAVEPHGLSIHDFADEYSQLLNPGHRHVKGFNPQEYLAQQLSGQTIGPTLFVFDNFETTNSPLEVFSWLDTYIRGPNKVLITSRDRQFTGDYVVRVQGMTHAEAEELIESTADTLGIRKRLNTEYVEQII